MATAKVTLIDTETREETDPQEVELEDDTLDGANMAAERLRDQYGKKTARSYLVSKIVWVAEGVEAEDTTPAQTLPPIGDPS
jgi:hypothetical protein